MSSDATGLAPEDLVRAWEERILNGLPVDDARGAQPDGVADPGDKFTSSDAAVVDARDYIRSKFAKESRVWEYGGLVLQNGDGTYTYTEPVTQGTAEVILPNCPPGARCTADYHNHLAHTDFSRRDHRGLLDLNRTGYLIWPNDKIIRWTPLPKAKRPLLGPLENKGTYGVVQ